MALLILEKISLLMMRIKSQRFYCSFNFKAFIVQGKCPALVQPAGNVIHANSLLIQVKNNGGLYFPSDDVVKVLRVCDNLLCNIPNSSLVPNCEEYFRVANCMGSIKCCGLNLNFMQ